jgi:hypothetical protein
LAYSENYLPGSQTPNASSQRGGVRNGDGAEDARAEPASQRLTNGDERLRELEGAANTIGRLQRMSLAIRKAGGSNSTFSRAARFVIYDEDVIESTGSRQQFEVDFRSYAHTLLSHRHRKLSETCRDRLADIMVCGGKGFSTRPLISRSFD